MAEIVEQLRAQGLHPSPLPLGLLRPGEPDGCILCNTCNSFPCKIHAKSDAEVCCVRPAIQRPNVTLWTNAYARRLITDATGRKVEAVEVERNGETVRVEAPLFVVSCGAVNSAALLLRSANDAHPNGLANSSGPRRPALHGAPGDDDAGVSSVPEETRPCFRRPWRSTISTCTGRDTPYPLGQIQSQGRTHGVMAQTVVPWIPLWAYDAWVARGVDWLAISEDLPAADNRVTVEPDGRIRLQYRPNNVAPHEQLVAETKRILRRLGFWVVVAHSHKEKNTTHQCGTLCFGTDPRESVLDPFCRTHDIDNLFVVDASFFPSSAAVNPGLTIAAQALRVADHIKDTHPWVNAESSIVQPWRHHGVQLQPGRQVLLGGVRLSAGRRGRHAAGPACARSSASTLPGADRGAQPRCKIGWIRVPGGAVLEIFEFQPQLPPAAVRGTASA